MVPAKASARGARQEAFVFWYGAIAQLGERVLCKHEVVGSIPSGSTSLRWLRQLRLREPNRSEGCPRRTSKSEDGLGPFEIVVRENITSHALSGWTRRAGYLTS